MNCKKNNRAFHNKGPSLNGKKRVQNIKENG